MNATSPSPAHPRPRGRHPAPRSQPSIAALLVAAGLVLVVVVLVLVFGIARPPELPDLAEEPSPAPSASIAWTSYGEDGSCLHTAEPTGTTAEVRCGWDGGELWAWTDEGIALWTHGLAGELEFIDPVTGDIRERRILEDARDGPSSLRTGVSSRRIDGQLIVRRADDQEVIWEVTAPEAYRVDDGSLSPDGEWIVMVDSAERLLVVPADGSTAPRVWVEGAETWQAPVWEGTAVQGRTNG